MNRLRWFALAALSAALVVFLIGQPVLSQALEAKARYSYAPKAVFESPGLKLLLDESNLGGDEVEIAEMVFTAGKVFESHKHGSIEIFYVLSGRLGHEVNGTLNMLSSGMIGVVKPGDYVRHIVPKDSDVKVLVIWAPGGEAARLFPPDRRTQRTQDPVK